MIIHTETGTGEGGGELVSAHSLHTRGFFFFLFLSGMRGRIQPTAPNPPGHAELKHEERTAEGVKREAVTV